MYLSLSLDLSLSLYIYIYIKICIHMYTHTIHTWSLSHDASYEEPSNLSDVLAQSWSPALGLLKPHSGKLY